LQENGFWKWFDSPKQSWKSCTAIEGEHCGLWL
jgi:hypothetical protein